MASLSRSILRALSLTAVTLALLLTAPASQAQDLADGFYLEDAVDTSFFLPVAVAFAPGGRMFVVEKRGIVWVVQNGQLQAEPFIDLTSEVLDQHDRGLLGIAVDPNFESNRRVYLAYVVDHQETADRERLDAYARVTSYAGQASNPNRAALSSRRVLLGETFATGIPACYKSHSIGTLQFGADGTLLVGTGDAASYNGIDSGGQYTECFGAGRLDASENIGAFRSQRVESLAGKILRIDPRTGRGVSSNPFWTGNPDDTASKVWALGLRNPYRFAVDTSAGSPNPAAGQPGPIYLGDVGFSDWEDIHIARGGENFGWPCYEGPKLHDNYPGAAPAGYSCSGPLTGTLTAPTRTFHHRNASLSQPAGRIARAITGGAINRGTRYPEAYQGTFFYGDYVSGWTVMSGIDGQGELLPERLLGNAVGPIVNYTYDPVGEYVHLVDVVAGRVRRLRHTDEGPNTVPVAVAHATPSQGGVGVRVQFSPAGSFDPEGDALSYSWTFGDGQQSSERAPVHVYDTPGVFRARLVVSDGRSQTTADATVTVRAGTTPRIQILTPTAALRAEVGTAVRLRASVSDPDQSAESLFVRWTITLVHDQHLHFDVFQGADRAVNFTVPEHGVAGEQVYYRIRAEVRDATGLEAIDETTLFVTGDGGEADVTAGATPIASVTTPAPGRGASNVSVIADGVYATAGGAPSQQEFATFTGSRARDLDWVGLEFGRIHNLSRITVQEGRTWANGGWFETTPRVQVRTNGVWQDVTAPVSAPLYRANDGRSYDTYNIRFAPAQGDAIRLIGPPGGSAGFVSVGEMRAWALVGPAPNPETGLPEGWVSADIGGPSGTGSASYTDGVFTIVGGGDIWQTSDRFHYAWRSLAGDATVSTQVQSITSTPDWAKAVLMLRGGPEADAPHVSLVLSNFGLHIQTRARSGAVTTQPVNDWDRTPPVWLRLDRSGTRVVARASLDGASWWRIGAVNVPDLAGPALIGLGVSAADYGTGATVRAEFGDVRIREVEPPSTELPDGWASMDIGSVATPGRAFVDADGFNVQGGGDLWNETDAFHFAFTETSGVSTITSLVDTPAGTHEWSKAGLMIRESPDPGSPHVWFGFSQVGLHLETRRSASGESEQVANDWGAGGPQWLRLERDGTLVRALRSADGEHWTPFGEVELAELADGTVMIGLAVSAADYGDGWLATGSFKDVQVVSTGARRPTSNDVVSAEGFGIDTIFPNPARAQTRVRISGIGQMDVTVLDALGRQVLSQQVQVARSGEVTFDLNRLPAGMYLVRVIDSASGEIASRAFSVAR